MKHEVKRLISFVALLVMMVSMLSVWAFPAAAAGEEEAYYENFLFTAKVVNPAWENITSGTVTYEYRGEQIVEGYDSSRHFGSFEKAWAQIEKENWSTVPTVLLCAGSYTKKIEVFGSLNLIGPNAGIDAVAESSKSDDESKPWEVNTARFAEAVINANIVIRMAAKDADFVFDGLKFGANGALVDNQRGNLTTPYESDMEFKNLVFENAGNSSKDARGNAINLDSKGVKRVLHLENIFVTGQNLSALTGDLAAGFLTPFYTELYAENIAYVNNKAGFLPLSFAEGSIIPVIEVTNSYFGNTTSSAGGYVISMDNGTYDKKPNAGGTAYEEAPVAISSLRPGASLKLHNNIFYNASADGKGIIHFELLNRNTVADIQNNYFYSSTPTAILETEFLLDSAGVDQSSCFVIRSNRLVGAYKIPTLAGANASTYIDMSNNYFGDVEGNTVYVPVYVEPDFPRLIRTSFWIDEEMTISSNPWDLSINDWPLASVDTTHYTGELSLYTENESGLFAANFSAAGSKTKVTLYKKGTVVSDSLIQVLEADKIDQITNDILPDGFITIYAKVENADYPGFSPVYAITIEKIGSLINVPAFEKSFDSNTFMYHPTLGDSAVGTVLPMKWNGEVYKLTVGTTLFGSTEKLFSYTKNNKIANPTILLPAGTYSEDLELYGSCVVLGETNGINPNKKPYEVIGENDLLSSAWSLNETWANSSNLTIFKSAIRVVKSADDFVITIDGIKFVAGGGIVEDEHRNKSNALVIKNIFMDAAGGFTNKAGGTSNYLFDFSKTQGNSKDILSVYLYDSRITNSANHAFGPCVEKLVIDGVYVGTFADDKQFFDDLSSRDVSNPYLSLTNSYFDRSAYGYTGFTFFSLDNSTGDQNVKTNIVYNIDNNVFFDAFASGSPLVTVKFTGTNMKYMFTNNIVYDAGNSDDLFSGVGYYVGNTASNDTSDMIVFKGNRLIRWRRLPQTTGTALGTQYDFSGNYFSEGLGLGGLDHIAANFDARTGAEGTTSASVLEAARRRTLNYTFLDWDMTVRSDAVLSDASYAFTKGMYGTGTSKNEALNGVPMMVYRDKNIPADCDVYDLPFTIGETATAKIYTSSVFAEDSIVEELRLSAVKNVFYVRVTSADGNTVNEFALILERKTSTENSILSFGDFLIDEETMTVIGHTNRRYIYLASAVKVSNGATFEMFNDADCTVPTDSSDVSFRPSANQPVVKYIKVTNESNTASKVYKFVLNYCVDEASVDVAGISSVEGMTRVDGNTFETTVSPAAGSISFKPIPYIGTTLKVYNGFKVIVPDANGVYTVENNGGVAQTLRVTAVAGNGKGTAEYKLNIAKKASSECELLAVEGANKTPGGFVLPVFYSKVADLDVTVSAGATYKVYSDYACTKVCTGDQVFVDGSNTFAYVKVTSENGNVTKVHKVALLTQAETRFTVPVVSAKVGNKTYTTIRTGANELSLYLPAGTASVTLEAKLDLPGSSAVTLNLFVDPANTKALSGALNLGKKITKAYLVNSAGSFSLDRYIPVSSDGARTMSVYGIVSEAAWTVNVISDQSKVAYSDASSIASWVKPYVNYLNDGLYKVFEGDAAAAFNGGRNITRNEIAVIATRVMGLDVSKYSDVQLDFNDKVVDWALPYVKAAVSVGIIDGAVVNGKKVFNGYANANREQVIKILVSILAVQDGIDVEKYYLEWENDVDLKYLANDFADDAKVSAWAAPYMHLAVTEYGLVNGAPVGDNMYLNPKTNITRAEVAKIVACMLGY